LPALRHHRKVAVELAHRDLVIFTLVPRFAGCDRPRDTVARPLQPLEFMPLGLDARLAHEDIPAVFECEFLPV